MKINIDGIDIVPRAGGRTAYLPGERSTDENRWVGGRVNVSVGSVFGFYPKMSFKFSHFYLCVLGKLSRPKHESDYQKLNFSTTKAADIISVQSKFKIKLLYIYNFDANATKRNHPPGIHDSIQGRMV